MIDVRHKELNLACGGAVLLKPDPGLLARYIRLDCSQVDLAGSHQRRSAEGVVLDIQCDDIGPPDSRDVELLVPDWCCGFLLLLRPEELLRIVDHGHVRVCASAIDTGEISASEYY